LITKGKLVFLKWIERAERNRLTTTNRNDYLGTFSILSKNINNLSESKSDRNVEKISHETLKNKAKDGENIL